MEDTIRALAAAWNAQDVDGYLAGFTDNGIADDLEGATREEAAQFLPEFIGEPLVTIRGFSNTEVSDNTASTEVEFVFGLILAREGFSLIKEQDVWKVDGEEVLTPEMPSGVTAIDLSMSEFAFSFDVSAVTSDTTIAFSVENVGQQPHQIILIKVPADFDLQAALQSEEEPPGIEDIAFLEPQDPGAETNLVFTQPLEVGRYVMVSFIEDPDSGQPHALLGMVSDFTIE